MLASIGSGVVGLVLVAGFIDDIYFQLGNAFIHTQTGHFQVGKNGYFEFGSRTPEKYLLQDADGLRQKIQSTPEVSGVMQRLDFAGILNNGSADLAILGEGVEAAEDAEFSSMLKMVAGRRLSVEDAYGVMLGKGVADSLKLQVGDSVTLVAATAGGAMNSLDLQVTGIFISFAKDYDDRAVRISLAAAQELIGERGISRMIGFLKNREQTDAIVQKFRTELGASNGLDIPSWIDLSDFYRNTVAAYEQQFIVIRAIIFLMVVFSVVNVVNMSIFERTGEFGTMRAIGNTGNFVSRMIIYEGIILGFFGAVIGLVIGIGLALLVSAIGIPMPPPPNMNQGYIAEIRLSTDGLIFAFFTGFIAPIPASLWPAWKVRKIPIVDALRENI